MATLDGVRGVSGVALNPAPHSSVVRALRPETQIRTHTKGHRSPWMQPPPRKRKAAGLGKWVIASGAVSCFYSERLDNTLL